MLKLINNYRSENGLDVLVESSNLKDSSMFHLKYLSKKGVISHIGKGGSSLKNRVDQTGVTGFTYGEVVGYAGSEIELLREWKNSSTHNSVILDPGWTFIGVSTVIKGDRVVSVINFSTGALGSTSIKKVGSYTYISGDYIKEVNFQSRGNFDLIKYKDGKFKIVIANQKTGFFIKVFSRDGILTDRLNIF